MPETGRNVRETSENGADARRGRQRLKRPMDLSSQGWAPTDRAPRLRRAAGLLESRADASSDPEKARRLARDMRLRAVKLELGSYADDELDEAVDLMREVGGAVGWPPSAPLARISASAA